MADALRILYVDDYRLDRELVRAALEQEPGQFQLTEAASRAELEKYLQTEHFDLVLSDFNISGYEGLEVLGRVKSLDPDIPVIIVTGTGTEKVAAESIKQGAADYLIKSPAEIRRLPHVIQTVMENKHLKMEQQAAHLALQESEALYRTLFEQASDGIFISDPQGWIMDMNRSALRMLGYRKKELRRMNISELMAPGEEEKNSVLFQKLSSGKALLLERRLKRKDGTQIIAEISAKQLPDGRLQGIVRDITSRKQTEWALKEQTRRNALILQTTLDGFILADTEGKLVDVNPAYCQMIGYRREELLKMNIRDLEVKIPPAEVEERINRMVRQGRDHFETRHRQKNGRIIDLDVSIAIMQTGEQQPLVAAFVRDITERKKAEAELKKHRAELQSLYANLQDVREEEQTRIAHEIHDELGQSLTVLKMDLAWLRRRLSTPEAFPEKLESMNRLLDDTIKTVQRISSELRPSLLADLGLVAAIEWQARKLATSGGLKTDLQIHVPEDLDLPQPVSTALFRIFQEAMTNVLRHAQATTVRVELGRRNGDCFLKISDDGVGISSARLRDSKSFGVLGMRERTNQLNGQFRITSKPGKGTTIEVRIPIRQKKGRTDD